MAVFLELPKLVQQYGMSEMQIGRGRIETGFDAQRLARTNFLPEFLFHQELVRAAFYAVDLPAQIFVVFRFHNAESSI